MSISAGEAICDAMEEEPWWAYVVSNEDGQIRISAGANDGIFNGLTLEVYGADEPVSGFDGQVFIIPGPRIGDIKVVDVTNTHATCTSISEIPIRKGYTVQEKN